ncbi:AAA family ATPase [Marinobacterium weihaiense]|uniref:ATP-binding protein n=1 Tax=Marinobacterium weihaiense TaxID=2851016 RepID=A0ABS6MEP7_9GAMM|nr:ATP-binding protein [Marinobacterium weihaiense]MBV0934798.1 ATP-binding protein [Marinobacterium weihaiense]
MFKTLKLTNVGPAPSMTLEFGQRLNLITGDNGLGKSFLLDVAWWSMTRKWPSEINPKLTVGKKVQPQRKGDSSISFSFSGKVKEVSYESTYQRREEAWTGNAGRPANPGLVLYAMTDGSFAVWDPSRNYWQTRNGIDVQERRPAYVFAPDEVWHGLKAEDGTVLCNGLVQDWATWQKEKGAAFKHLVKVLKVLSPSDKEELQPGDLTRISLDEARDIPTIRMPYGQDVPVVHASSGIRRIIALAYFLVWAWEEHRKAADLLQEDPTHQVVFLIDEVESHLHPSWQRSIIPALLSVMEQLTRRPDVQLITATHSPLIMASVEPVFDPAQDAWFDLDLEQGEVKLRQRDFEPMGDASNWLTSEAFDLKSSGSLANERLIKEASELLEKDTISKAEFQEMNTRLVRALNPADDFLFNWRYICKSKGLM